MRPQDFQARSETAGVSKDVLQDQMKYLVRSAQPRSHPAPRSRPDPPPSQGGDEHHSILVKGLDIALLERKKAELAQRADQDLGDVEDELDAAFENPAPPREHSGSPAAFEGASPVAGSSRDAGKKRGGKTRDELLAELRAMRTGGAAAAPGGATEGYRSSGSPAESRFKPIGASSADKKGKGKEAAGASGTGGGWKAVGASGDAPAGEKKKRKKRKVAPAEAAEASGTTAAESKAPAPEPAAATAPPAAAPIVPPAPDDIDDDMDIFGGVGDYKGLDTDEDSDAEAAPAPVPAAESANPLETASGGKRKYFDDDDEEDAVQTSTAPGGLGDLAAKQAAADAAAAAGAGARSGLADPAGGEGDEQEGEEGSGARRPVRLEGFSGSGPSVKELLELDKAREAEEKRQAVRCLLLSLARGRTGVDFRANRITPLRSAS